MPKVGLQSELDVESSPTIPATAGMSMPHFWSWFWFGAAVAVILGFHIRVFGRAVPPRAAFP